MKYDVLIFSKDRACQLDLCIRTIQENFPYLKIYIQYTFSNEQFHNGYLKLISKNPDVHFIKEHGFKQTFQEIFNLLSSYFLILVDDDVFINPAEEKQLSELISIFEQDKAILSISLRMNPEINYCYPAKKQISTPSLEYITSYIMKWNWTTCDTNYCWGYPHPIDSTLYCKDEVKDLFFSGNYQNPTYLETHIKENADKKRPFMISPTQSKIYSIQNNFVKFSKINSETLEINQKYLNGYTISTKNIYGLKEKKAHGLLPYFLELQ